MPGTHAGQEFSFTMNQDRLSIYYRILNVAPGASAKEIKLAYRKLAFEFHPDRNTDADSEEKFKDITEAYEILTGERKAPAQASSTKNGSAGAQTKSSTSSAYGPDAAGARNANKTRQGFAGSGRKEQQANPSMDDKVARANQAYREQQAKASARKSNIHPGARRHKGKRPDSNAAGFIQCAVTGVVSAQPRLVEFKSCVVFSILSAQKSSQPTLPPKGLGGWR